jgi:hypothetical protein
MVLTSHDQLGNISRKTGFWLEELVAPYYVFKDAGAQITLASPKDGRPPLDPKSNEPNFQTDITRRFEKDVNAEDQLLVKGAGFASLRGGIALFARRFFRLSSPLFRRFRWCKSRRIFQLR